MDGTKIEMAREAVDHAVRLLKPTDHLAVVCYDEESPRCWTELMQPQKQRSWRWTAWLPSMRAARRICAAAGRAEPTRRAIDGRRVGVSKVMLLTEALPTTASSIAPN